MLSESVGCPTEALALSLSKQQRVVTSH